SCRQQDPTAAQITFRVTTALPATGCGHGRWQFRAASTAGFRLKQGQIRNDRLIQLLVTRGLSRNFRASGSLVVALSVYA
ncbi:MAG: hypothetical protein ABIZ80_17835, partial [Bryobacteraceae bacterium]